MILLGGQSGNRNEESGYTLKERVNEDEVILEDVLSGEKELWVRSPNFAGYAVVIENETYEFVSGVG